MPAAKKVAWAQLRIGIMASVSLVILGALIFLLTGSGDLFTSNATLYTYMADSAAMLPNTAVRLNGISVGKIDVIALNPDPVAVLKDKDKVVIIKMKVKRKMLEQIPEDSLTIVDAANLLGEKFLNIQKGKSPVSIKDGGTLKSLGGGDIPELVKRAGDMLGTLQIIIGRFDALLADIEGGKGNVGKFIKDETLYDTVLASVKELNKIVNTVSSGKGAIGHFLNDEDFFQEIRSPLKRFDSLLADLQQGQGTAGKVLKDPALYDDFRQTIADMRRLINVDFKKILDDLNAGKGTAGKILKDEELYRRANQLVANLETSLDKVNAGQGTLGQLLVNPQLYESLNGVTREMQGLVKDIHANPKKFLRIKLGLF
jgi:phospholipid/cholesterol/gamma-HCH transport system substrate-binding protein